MKLPPPKDAYIIDTCKLSSINKFIPGAITFKGRKKLQVMQWKNKKFSTQQEADEFVRRHFVELGIEEAENEGALSRSYTRW